MKKAIRLKLRANKVSWQIRSESMSDNELADHLRVTTSVFLVLDSWKKLRLEVIKRYGNACLKCGREGTKKSPINIDHIKPRKYYPELAMDIDNLQPLCAGCNREKGNKTADYRER